MSDATQSNPDQGPISPLTRAFLFGMLCAQQEPEPTVDMDDGTTMQFSLISLINEKHNEAVGQTIGMTPSADDLVKAFKAGAMLVRGIEELKEEMRKMLINCFNDMIRSDPSILMFPFGASFTGACVDDRAGEPTPSGGEPGSGS